MSDQSFKREAGTRLAGRDVRCMFCAMPCKPRGFGLKFEVRIRDLEARDVLRVRCPQCSHVASVATHELFLRFPAYMRLVDTERYMRCKRCDHRGSMTWHVEQAVPPVS